MITRMFLECSSGQRRAHLAKSARQSDVCVDGMILNYASYFCPDERVRSVGCFLLSEPETDGGFSGICRQFGDPHKPSVSGRIYAVSRQCRSQCRFHSRGSRPRRRVSSNSTGYTFIIADERFRNSPTRTVIATICCVPGVFATASIPYDARMRPAIEWLEAKRQADGFWYLEHQHKGNVHFVLEETGKPSQFITLKSLFILNYFQRLPNLI